MLNCFSLLLPLKFHPTHVQTLSTQALARAHGIIAGLRWIKAGLSFENFSRLIIGGRIEPCSFHDGGARLTQAAAREIKRLSVKTFQLQRLYFIITIQSEITRRLRMFKKRKKKQRHVEQKFCVYGKVSLLFDKVRCSNGILVLFF